MNKKTFFGTQTVTQTLEARTAVYARSKRELTARVEHLPDNKVLIIPEAAIALPPTHYSQANWMKRGKSVKLPRHQRNPTPATGPTRLRHKTYQETTLDDFTGGYEWNTTDNRKRKKVLLTDCLEGARLFYFAQQATTKGGRIKVGKAYHSRKESPQHGRTYAVEVPSRTKEETYVFKLNGVPTDNTQSQHNNWRNITTDGHTGGKKKGTRHEGCERKFYAELTFGRPELVEQFCPHEIAAYMAITQKEHTKQGRVILQPFALPSAQAVEFYKTLRERVFVEEEGRTKKGMRQLRRRPLTIPEKELILGRKTIEEARRGNNFFYARNLLRHHSW